MVPHGGSDTRIFRETAALGAELASLSALRGSTVNARVAILWDWESNWALDLEWRPTVELSHRRVIEAFYSRMWHDGITVDFAHPSADLSGYDLVLAPSLYLLSEKDAANLAAFVERGGVFVCSYFSGIVDEHDTVPPGASPGFLRELLGIRIEEFRPLAEGEQVELSTGAVASTWVDDLTTTSAGVVARYVSGPSEGGPAITRNEFGRGTAWYLSTEFDPTTLAQVLAAPLAEAGISAAEPSDVETIVRVSDDATFTVSINHGTTDARIATEDGVELSHTDTALGTLPAGAVSIIRRTIR
jgi:beta-galactosidase